VALLMEETINQFRRREIDLPTAKTFGMLASVMLCAVKQEYDEREAAMMETEAIRPAQPMRPPEAMRANPPAPDSGAATQRPDRIPAPITPIAAAKPPEDHKPHPAAIPVTNASTANQIAASHA
jgi:hypothetical protein